MIDRAGEGISDHAEVFTVSFAITGRLNQRAEATLRLLGVPAPEAGRLATRPLPPGTVTLTTHSLAGRWAGGATGRSRPRCGRARREITGRGATGEDDRARSVVRHQ
jgi:hypothetical protein